MAKSERDEQAGFTAAEKAAMKDRANEAGTVVCFFQAAAKWDTRYATLNFEHPAKLDDGDMWPTSFAVTKLTPAVVKRIVDLVKRAARP